MKKLILIIIIFYSSISYGQWNTWTVSSGSGVSTSIPNTWTGTQTFSTLIADLVITNRVDSTTSIRLYDTSGTLYALFSSDTSWIPNLTVGNLNSTTIINGTSVTTNSVISDTIISNSPLFLRSDSIFTGITNDSSRMWIQEINYGGRMRGAIYPNIDYGMNIGLYNKRVDTVNARVGRFTKMFASDTLRIGTVRMFEDNENGSFIKTSYGFVTPYLKVGLVASPFAPSHHVTFDLGTSSTTWKNTYTRTLNSDSILTKSLNLDGVIIDSAFVSGDTLKFRVGSTIYNAVKGSGFTEWFYVLMLIGVACGLYSSFKKYFI